MRIRFTAILKVCVAAVLPALFCACGAWNEGSYDVEKPGPFSPGLLGETAEHGVAGWFTDVEILKWAGVMASAWSCAGPGSDGLAMLFMDGQHPGKVFYVGLSLPNEFAVVQGDDLGTL